MFLLDVNALVAWWHGRSPHHQAFHAWVARVGSSQVRTCALGELGFIRVSMQVFGYSLRQSQDALAAIRKDAGPFVEAAPVPRLATWASTPARTSDAYLVQVAAAHGLRLATFDAGIRDPAAELIA